MCGRYNLTAPPERLAHVFCVPDIPPLQPRYNIAPTQNVLIVRQAAVREGVLVRWGLVPSWSDDLKIGYKLINARGETVATKPSFRSAFKHRRCLVVADGFYEWKKVGKAKQPYHIHLTNNSPFAFAGLWEYWESAEGESVESCTIVTTTANDVMKPLHDRMPVILGPAHYDRWLDPQHYDREALQTLLVPYPKKGLTAVPVSTFVNRPRNEGPKCVEPLPV
jgi:putative SOS response-associated peptidase YedK